MVDIVIIGHTDSLGVNNTLRDIEPNYGQEYKLLNLFLPVALLLEELSKVGTNIQNLRNPFLKLTSNY